MPAPFTTNQYFTSRIPDIATLLPGYDTSIAITAAMALYWGYFFPTQNPAVIDEATLSERQKSLCALRAVLATIPVATALFTSPQVTEAIGGPAAAKFEERNKIFRACMPLWTDEIRRLEAAEGINFEILPNVPAFLLKIQSCFDSFVSADFIVDRNVEIVVI